MKKQKHFKGNVTLTYNNISVDVIFNGASELSEEIKASAFGTDSFKKGSVVGLSFSDQTDKRPKIMKLSRDCVSLRVQIPFQDILGRVL